ncbi:MAG: foldase protein PrsA [Candidatus Cyclobacteriaceae bacterium M3_2C_046]
MTAVILALTAACKTTQTPQSSDAILFKVGEEPVSTEEFLYVFNKNNYNDSVQNRQAAEDYLKLFINFKLKVKEARNMGLQHTSEFVQEFETYRDELAKPYLTETRVTASLVEEAYQRMKTEVNASHILIRVDENASPQDTLKAWETIREVYQKATSGDDFSELAQQYSQDPSARNNQGKLGYFSSMQMVYPFENAAYETPQGQVSEPFKTRFGYHILKVWDKRPSQGKLKTSHIMLRATSGISEQDSIKARNKIYEIYKLLQNGEDWNKLCAQFTEDLSSKPNNGALPWFGTGGLVPEFEQAAFALQNIGDFSAPVKTAYGWHIIKLDDKKDLEPFDQVKPELTERVKRDSRSSLSQQVLVQRLKKENGYKESSRQAELLKQLSENMEITDEWQVKDDSIFMSQALFHIGQKPYLMADFVNFLEEQPLPQSPQEPYDQLFSQKYQDYVNTSLVEFEKSQLSEKYPDYRMLVKEYEEGILLFQLMDEKVWTKAVRDSAGLEAYYQQHKENYRWKERAKATILNAANQEVLMQARDYLDQQFINIPASERYVEFETGQSVLTPPQEQILQGVANQLVSKAGASIQIKAHPEQQDYAQLIRIYLTDLNIPQASILLKINDQQTNAVELSLITTSKEVLEDIFNKQSSLTLQVEEGNFEKGVQEVLNKVSWAPGTYQLEHNDRYYLIEIEEILPDAYKSLHENRGTVISDYQDFLEKKWIKQLKEKYPVTIDQKELEKLYKKIEQA